MNWTLPMEVKLTPEGLQTRDAAFEVKSVEDTGVFTGYGAVFGNEDAYGEVIEPGAFTESLAEHAKTGRPVPALWQHRPAEPVGYYSELKEDKTGLWVKGHLLLNGLPKAAEVLAMMKAKIVTGLSIGFVTRADSYDEKTKVRHLQKVDLWEVSPVTFPANANARIDGVKLALAHGLVPRARDMEEFLRESGASKTLATAMASRLAGLGDRRESEPEAAKTILERLDALKL